MSDPTWSSVEEYFESQFLPADPVLEAALEASVAAGLPPETGETTFKVFTAPVPNSTAPKPQSVR